MKQLNGLRIIKNKMEEAQAKKIIKENLFQEVSKLVLGNLEKKLKILESKESKIDIHEKDYTNLIMASKLYVEHSNEIKRNYGFEYPGMESEYEKIHDRINQLNYEDNKK